MGVVYGMQSGNTGCLWNGYIYIYYIYIIYIYPGLSILVCDSCRNVIAWGALMNFWWMFVVHSFLIYLGPLSQLGQVWWKNDDWPQPLRRIRWGPHRIHRRQLHRLWTKEVHPESQNHPKWSNGCPQQSYSLHICHIYLHLDYLGAKCHQIFHTWRLWEWLPPTDGNGWTSQPHQEDSWSLVMLQGDWHMQWFRIVELETRMTAGCWWTYNSMNREIQGANDDAK